MLLEADSERLYVGARGAVFALNASDISASSALTVSLVCYRRCCMFCASAAVSLTLQQLHLHSIQGTKLFGGNSISFEAKVFIPLSPLVCFVTPQEPLSA